MIWGAQTESLAEARGRKLRLKYLAEDSHQAVIIETDHGNLPNRHQAAQTAVDNRLYELQLDDGGTPEERTAISDPIRADP